MENRTADTILNDKAFDCMDKNTKEAFKRLYISIQGKSKQEALPIIVGFVSSLPRGMSFTPEQKKAMLSVLLANFSEADKNRLMNIMHILGV